VFPPKGDLEGDHIEVVRSPKDTRPINLKNSDCKILSSTMNYAISKPVAKLACFAVFV
jgi:hypothetical protein